GGCCCCCCCFSLPTRQANKQKFNRGKGKMPATDEQPRFNIDCEVELSDEEQTHLYTTQETMSDAHTRSIPSLKSSIFTKHFDKITLPNGEMRAKCKYCSQSYKFQSGGGYGSLKRHVEKKHPVEFGIDRTQTQMPSFASSGAGGGNDLSLFKYNDVRCRENLARFISVEHLSFSFANKFFFNELIQTTYNPAAKGVPRTTLTRYVKKLYNKSKKELKELLNNVNNKISLCSDIWSDHWQIHSYMGITCHWIDNSWTLQKRLLAFRVFDSPHTAANISQIIFLILEEYNLVNKIFSISFDNAAANNASIGDLKVVCEPSIDGLKVLDNQLKPIRQAFSYLWTHPHINKQWFRFCKANGVRPKKFPRDVPTRWNSTYRLLEESIDYKDLLCQFFVQIISTPFHLYPHHWTVCEKICNILKIFNDATLQLSSVYSPTSHLVLLNCCNIASVLHENINSQDENLVNCTLSMQLKWKKYFYEIPDINLIAVVFDPRLKLDGLQDLLLIYYNALTRNENDYTIDINNIIFKIRTLLNEFYNEYSSKYGSQSTQVDIHKTSSSSGFKLTAAQLLLRERTKRPRGSSSSSQELESYFNVSFEFNDTDDDGEFDILRWWSQKEQTYPILSVMAKEILASPASTVAVEQVFSAGGNILSEKRSTLSPENLEAQACLDDWIKASQLIENLMTHFLSAARLVKGIRSLKVFP
ncbi:hypothetical protein Pfo_029589, partial [Paulownia fortunei]